MMTTTDYPMVDGISAADRIPATVRWLLLASDEEFESGVQDLNVPELLQLISHLQHEMTVEQQRFDQLGDQLQQRRHVFMHGCSNEVEEAETASLSSALCRSQIRLAQLCTRNMRCFTQQAIRAQQERKELLLSSSRTALDSLRDECGSGQSGPESGVDTSSLWANHHIWGSRISPTSFQSHDDDSTSSDDDVVERDQATLVARVPSVQDILQSVRALRLSGVVAQTQLLLKPNGSDDEEAAQDVKSNHERKTDSTTTAGRPRIPSPDYNSDDEDTSISTAEENSPYHPHHQWHGPAEKDEPHNRLEEGDDLLSCRVRSDLTPAKTIPRSAHSCPDLEDTLVHGTSNGVRTKTASPTTTTLLPPGKSDEEEDDDDSGVGAEEQPKRGFGGVGRRRRRERVSLFDHVPQPPQPPESAKSNVHATTVTNESRGPNVSNSIVVEENGGGEDEEEVIPSIIDQFDSPGGGGHWEEEPLVIDGRQKKTNVFWNPERLLRTFYKVPEPLPPTNPPTNYINMEGYLDKLPSGRKQATYWHAWKRRYFKLKDGYLYCYANAKAEEASLCIQMMGGRVDTVESHLLGIDDGKGHYVVVRCGSRSDSERWRRAIITHTAENYQQTYAQPVPPYPQFYEDVVVIDIGSCSVRGGILCNQPTLPQVYFPTVCAKDRTTGNIVYGTEAVHPKTRKTSTISFPLKPSAKITKFTVNLEAVKGILTKVFAELNVDPSDYQIQLSLPRSFPFKTQTEVLDLLMTQFGVRAVNLTAQTVLALCSYNSTSGVVVDIGERTEVVPIVDGYVVESGVSRIPYGGSRLYDHLRHFLMQRHYGLVSEMESFLLRYVLENACYCAEHYKSELQRFHSDPKSFEVTLAVGHFFDGDSPWDAITLDSGRFQTPEGLFNPDAWGLDNPGIHKLVSKAIQECGLDARKEMSRSIFLSGGVTMLPGFTERLQMEVDRLTPPAITPKVHASPYRAHAAYLGACVWAAGAGFHHAKITRNDWVAQGSTCLKKWHF